MAKRTTKTRLNTRTQLDQRMTFDNTTPDLSVEARPVDAVAKKDVSSKAMQVAEALGLGAQGLNGLQALYEKRVGSQMNEGSFMAQKGEDKPTKGEFLIKGYETAEGKIAGLNYRKEVNEYLINNYEKLSPQEFNEGLQALSDKYMEDAPSDEYLKGFLPIAQQEEDKITMQYQEIMAEDFQVQSTKMVSQIMNDETENILKESLGIEGVGELDEVMEDPQAYLKMIGRTEGSDADVRLREALTETQEIAKGMNLDRQTVSGLLVLQVGEMAKEYGLPALLDFASLPDESKIALENNPDLMQVINRYRQDAQTKQDRTLELQDITAEKQIKEEQDRFINETTYAINDIIAKGGTPTEKANAAAALREELNNNEAYIDLNPSTYSSIDRTLANMEAGRDTFRSESVASVRTELRNKIYNREITAEDVLTNAENLSRVDYDYFLNFIEQRRAQQEQAALNEQQQQEANLMEQQKERQKEIEKIRGNHWSSVRNNIIDYLAEKIGTDTWANPEKAATLELLFDRMETEYLMQNEFQFPSISETDKMFNDYLKTSGEGAVSVNELMSGAYGGEDIDRADSFEGTLNQKEEESRLDDAQLEVMEEQPEPFEWKKQKSIMGMDLPDDVDGGREQIKTELKETQGSYQLPRVQVYENFYSGLQGGNSFNEIIEGGVSQGVFKNKQEGNDYAAAYALGYAENVLRNQGVVYADEVLAQLQEQGLSESGALQVVRQAIKLAEQGE